MVSEEAIGICVVGGDGWCGEVVFEVFWPQLGVAHFEQALVDALAQLGCCLAGEGEAENLFRSGVTICHEPKHSNRHELGFAAACAGNNQRWAVHAGILHRRLLFGS